MCKEWVAFCVCKRTGCLFVASSSEGRISIWANKCWVQYTRRHYGNKYATQLPAPAGAQSNGGSPSALIKKRRTSVAGPGTPILLEPKIALKQQTQASACEKCSMERSLQFALGNLLVPWDIFGPCSLELALNSALLCFYSELN